MERQREDGAGYLSYAGERASPVPSAAGRTRRERGDGGFAGERRADNGVSFRSLARSSVFYFLMIFFRERRGVTALETVHVAGGSRVRVGPRWARAQRELVSVRPTSDWPKITLP
jgi:hypothetical protein